MPFGSLGMGEIVVILVIFLLLFGARRLPELGGALGKGIREFRRSVREIQSELNEPVDQVRELQPRRDTAAVPPAGGSTVAASSERPKEAEAQQG
ncbi:MAG TPA: twin-arginine translocase TatA/TatE family subunit [Longimicrobiales bacterium]|nr:twin-arginine translocase TatA/TatE family subunit [Longimicrobiales bacterium]